MDVGVGYTFILGKCIDERRVDAHVTSVTTHSFGAECQVARLSAEIFIKHINGKSGCLF